MKKLIFEEISEEDYFIGYTAQCSGGVSDCCTRVCTRTGYKTSEEWGRFLEAEGGVVQY